jgi:hypothetical protein
MSENYSSLMKIELKTSDLLSISRPGRIKICATIIILLTSDFLNNFFAHPYKIIASKGGLTHHLKA